MALLSKIKTFSYKYEPEILVGIGLAGLIATIFMTHRSAVVSYKQVESRKKEISKSEKIPVESLPKKEVVSLVWKNYIPPMITGIASIGCVIGGTTVKFKKYSALATAFSVTEAAMKTYQEKIIETIGEKKERTIRDNILEEKIKTDDRSTNNIYIASNGNMRCYDTMSDRYFTSDIEKIRQTVNELNRRMISDMYISLNEFYDELGLPEITIGNALGWNVNSGYIELDYSSHLAPDGVPCLAISYSYSSPPRPDFMDV